MLEVFNETQALLLALLAQSTIFVKHCVKLAAAELTVYNASKASKIQARKGRSDRFNLGTGGIPRR